MKKKSNLKELMGYAGGHRYLTYLSLLLSAVSAVLALFPFVFLFRIIQEVIAVAPNYAEAAQVVHNGWMAVGFALASIVIYVCALMCSHLSAFRIAGNIRKALMAHIAELPLGFIGEMGSGKIRRIVNDSSAATETYLAHQLPDMSAAITTPVCMIVMLFLFDWRFGLVSLLPIVLGFAAMFKMVGPQMAKDMKDYMDALADMNNEAVEYVRGIPVVKTFGQTVHSFARFKGTIDNYYKYCIAYCKKCRGSMLMYTVFINSAFAFLIVLALILTGDGPVAQPILLNFLFYVIFTPIIATAMSKVMYMSENGMIVADALSRIHTVLDEKPLPETRGGKAPMDNSVVLENVSFRYKGGAEDAIKDVTIRVGAGETVALVGPSGGGKTTVAGLISRFWDVTGGAIQIGGVNVKDIPKETLMDTVAYVFQDSRLLKASILENVRLARPNASRQEVERVLHEAQCDDIIAKLPQGIDTVIGTRGVYLSGGEQQRIAIARVMLKNAPILILDEATAFADPENEALVQQAFEQLSKGKTVIMIAHRLTTVKNADRIFVLREGRVEESGTHDALVAGGGLYAKMWQDYQTSVSWKVGAAK
ncbi:ABC transporter ATP-binding protein [Vermiculatibacterium agrestimuris]|uniref:ABC transporter ATP-binding protein n=1 Tax=Vermiculatibacterium agrestimuris TaxID=2941519 RepID=UPI00203A4E95|nr:ABC transporter ATP-binding protein [Vermiculatibacterium agrestimuris]